MRMEIAEEAERILSGWILLPGRSGDSFVGKEIPDWRHVPCGNRDIEAVFVLNRHEHWNILMKAYKETGDERYADRVWRELENWCETCPCPKICLDSDYVKEYFDTYTDETKACWRSLEAGIRMFRVWRNIPLYLFDSKSMKEEYFQHFCQGLLWHGQVLSQVSPVLFPGADHNHYLMESYGLLALGGEYSFLPHSEQWKNQGALEVKRCILTQITEDGGHIEGCPHYHNESLKLMAEAVLDMRNYGIPVEEIYLDRLKKALAYTCHTIRPTGVNVAFGDSDASDTWKQTLEACEKALGVRGEKMTLMNCQRQLGQVFVRNGFTRESASLAVLCKSPVQNEHSHIDAGSFEFTAFGKTMLTDPGRYTYRECEERQIFKSAQYHNTLLINGKSPFSYLGTWKYSPQKPAYLTAVNENYIEMRQEAYLPAVHQRRIDYYLDDEQPWLRIRDTITGLKQGEYAEVYYHLDFTDVQEIPGRTGVYAQDLEKRVFCQIVVSGSNTKGQILEGKISDKMDCIRESRRYKCCSISQGEETMEIVTLILAGKKMQG